MQRQVTGREFTAPVIVYSVVLYCIVLSAYSYSVVDVTAEDAKGVKLLKNLMLTDAQVGYVTQHHYIFCTNVMDKY